MRQGDRAAYWASHIREQAGSGLSVRAYCRQHRFSQPSFYRWRRRLDLIADGDGGSAGGFVEVVASGEAANSESGVRLRSGNWFTIELSRGFDVATLREALRVVREECSCSR